MIPPRPLQTLDTMKLGFYLILALTTDAFNRLELFKKHHNGVANRHGRMVTGIEKRSRLQARSRTTMRDVIRKIAVNQLCNIQTCTKCNKLITFGLSNNYCTLIINMQHCCSTEHMLYGGF